MTSLLSLYGDDAQRQSDAQRRRIADEAIAEYAAATGIPVDEARALLELAYRLRF